VLWRFCGYLLCDCGEKWNVCIGKILMITSETPYKLAEIIRDTWPQLYRPPIKTYNKSSINIPQNYTKK
jgi:hypothetical protein